MDFFPIFWLGGAPCSGKSTLARLLVEAYDLRFYSIDEQFGAHLSRFSPVNHPTMTRWTSTPWDALWMQPRQELLAQAIAAYSEYFSLVLQDLEALPCGPLLVEGNPCMPGLVASLAVSLAHVLYLLPEESFLRERYARRSDWVQGILSQCRDPECSVNLISMYWKIAH